MASLEEIRLQRLQKNRALEAQHMKQKFSKEKKEKNLQVAPVQGGVLAGVNLFPVNNNHFVSKNTK